MPPAVPAATRTVAVEDWPEVTASGVKATLTPVGAPDAERRTFWASPLVVAVFTATVAEPPGATVPAAGSAESEKSSFGAGASPTAVFQIVYAMPSALRFSAVALMLEVVSQAEW